MGTLETEIETGATRGRRGVAENGQSIGRSVGLSLQYGAFVLGT
ncbi:hypothetical protein [Halomontanus rarus]|nr:hypothetical protein [Halovivax sp. TS33]